MTHPADPRPIDSRPLDNRAADTRPTTDARSVPQLLSDLARDLTTLFRKEGQLIRAEMADKITQIEIGAGSIAAGAICLLVAFIILAMALSIALGNLIGDGWAALVVGVLIAGVGAFLLKKGTDQMKASNLTPSRSAHQLGKDADLVKEQVR